MCVDDEPGRVGQQPSSRGVKQVVHRSTSASAPGLVLDDRALVVHAGAGVERARFLREPHLEVRRERADRDSVHRAAARGAIPASTSTIRRPGPTRPNAPWHNEMAASNSPSNGSARASSRTNVARAVGCVRSVARSTKRCEMSIPTTSMPRAASACAWRPARTRRRAHAVPVADPSASTRNATSCSVPFVNEYRR